MKLITAIVQPEKVEKVKESLIAHDIRKMTVSRVNGCGQQMGYDEIYRGQIHKINLIDKVRFEILVSDEHMDETMDIIADAAGTEQIGDGKIWVLEVVEAMRIRTKERGAGAVG